ncbi:MAG: hypothetical protein PHY05_08335 [Methanothrix sp.]|jgi:hypothetical protein|nr:hypothetical protein [Methanothrix sp.]
MKKAKVLLAFVVLFIVAMSVANAAQQVNRPGNSIATMQKPKLDAPTIDIILIKIAPASPGNSEPVNVGVKVVSGGMKQDICGLDASNFNLETLTVPPGGPAIVIKNIYPTSSVAINQPVSCDYWLDMVPTSYQGNQYTWLTGTYTLKLNYVADGQQLASKTFSFRV